MPELPNAPKRLNSNSRLSTTDGDALRKLSRSPHPYHHLPSELLHPQETLEPNNSSPRLKLSQTVENNYNAQEEGGMYSRQASQRNTSDSGTEADDEHFLKGLPAPRLRPHKGLRNGDGKISSASSPLHSPAILKTGERKDLSIRPRNSPASRSLRDEDVTKANERFRRKRRKEVGRRVFEILLLGLVGLIVMSGDASRMVIWTWRRELVCQFLIFAFLTLLYPFRMLFRSGFRAIQQPSRAFSIPAEFDPAPLLYPPWITLFVATLLGSANPAALLPNILLGIASLPIELIPAFGSYESRSVAHWLLSCVPLFISNQNNQELSAWERIIPNGGFPAVEQIEPEKLILLYPLHKSLCITLHYLTTTSLLRAELELLSISLINVLFLSSSPQAIILKALLWGGGISMFILCGRVLKWVVTLARVPKWRFRKASNIARISGALKKKRRIDFASLLGLQDDFGVETAEESSDGGAEDHQRLTTTNRRSTGLKPIAGAMNGRRTRLDSIESNVLVNTRLNDSASSHLPTALSLDGSSSISRRHTLPNLGLPNNRSRKQTPSGRRKRSASSSLQSFFSLTERQATVRKWVYSAWVYICVVGIILAGIRPYIGNHALGGHEPVGWALGYLFGNIPSFRLFVVTQNLESWISLPPRLPLLETLFSFQGPWIHQLRLTVLGPSSTRLLICGIYLLILTVGLATVLTLANFYEVDTRRKIFHFIMVAMLLPTTFIDPTFAALALTLILALFLLLDLFRASQLPPVSRPLAVFLAPYVDGRDLRGPVVISHIFLLVGCAIPLWLSLGALGRSESENGDSKACDAGWEVPTRDASMIAGVVCVGMGDAAASLIGRRYGRHKWFWGGGKSLEGSVAFALAVTIGLLAAKIWLRVGGWKNSFVIDGVVAEDRWLTTVGKAGLAACMASLTEAVLTGGNDNVVVPVVLWLCVRGLGI